ncbi:hypothetical protein EfmAA242_21930 [Enterococcus faecium]|nr:hypothetical protein EfmAA242_21930 [Enterococcus faecium]
MKIIVDNFFTILLIMNILLSFIIVFRERKETAQTWAWLLVLMFIVKVEEFKKNPVTGCYGALVTMTNNEGNLFILIIFFQNK